MIASPSQARSSFRGDLLRAAGMLGVIAGLCAGLAWLGPVELFAPWPR
jgi:hypothetical protein